MSSQPRPRNSRAWASTAAAIALGISIAGAQGATQQEIEDLRKERGLRAAAMASPGRHYAGFEMIEVEMLAANLEAVAASSDVVVVGQIGRNRTRLAKDANGKETVVLDYFLLVLEVLKGPPSLLADGLTLTIPGGRYHFPDGATVDIATPGFRKPGPGDEYVFFMRAGGEYGNYQLSWGRQALFRLAPGGRVESGGSFDYPTSEGLSSIRREAFVDRVRRAISAFR